MPNFLRCIETDVKNDEEFEMIRNMSRGSLVEELIGSEKVALFFLKSIPVYLRVFREYTIKTFQKYTGILLECFYIRLTIVVIGFHISKSAPIFKQPCTLVYQYTYVKVIKKYFYNYTKVEKYTGILVRV